MIYVVRWLLTIALLAAALAVLGFLVFLGQVQMQPVPAAVKADGIVVLTGGEGRVAVGLRLLKDMRGGAMLISGVPAGTTKESIIAAQDITDPAQRRLLTCCVDLGHAAGSTVGNAEEAAAWVRRKKPASLLVVTAAYHIPRARLEFAQAFKEASLPDTKLVYYPLARENVKVGGADEMMVWRAPLQFLRRFPGTAELLVHEYGKYVFALGRAVVRYTE